MKKYGLSVLLMIISTTALAVTQVDIYKIIPNVDKTTIKLGTVTMSDTAYGLLIVPDLKGLPPGIHGFHLHEKPSCADSGMAAGGHLDPQHTGIHMGPYNTQGHLGDMPALTVTADGKATLPILAPRLKEVDLPGHSVMIHAGGDNYSDDPPMGGGGARIACGEIPK